MTKLIKYTVEHFRAEGISEQEFEKFLMEVHIPTAIALFKKYGIVKYSIQRRLPEHAAIFEPMLKSVNPDWNVSKADVVIQYWMPDLDCLAKVVSDTDWSGKAVKGQEKFIDMSRGTAHVGEETTYLEDGEARNL